MGLETLALILALNGPMNKIENIPEKIIPNYSTELVKEKNDLKIFSNKLKSPNNSFPKFHLGLYGPFPDILDLRLACDFNNIFGAQANIGLGFIEADCTARIGGPLYIYAGGLTIAPWMYALSEETPSSPSFGIEAGPVFPIPPDPNTGWAFRGGIFATYQIF